MHIKHSPQPSYMRTLFIEDNLHTELIQYTGSEWISFVEEADGASWDTEADGKRVKEQ